MNNNCRNSVSSYDVRTRMLRCSAGWTTRAHPACGVNKKPVNEFLFFRLALANEKAKRLGDLLPSALSMVLGHKYISRHYVELYFTSGGDDNLCKSKKIK